MSYFFLILRDRRAKLRYLGPLEFQATSSHSDLTRFMKRNPRTYQRDTRDCHARETMPPPPWEKTHDCRSPSWQTALFKAPPVTRVYYPSVASRVVETPCFRPATRDTSYAVSRFSLDRDLNRLRREVGSDLRSFASRDPRYVRQAKV